MDRRTKKWAGTFALFLTAALMGGCLKPPEGTKMRVRTTSLFTLNGAPCGENQDDLLQVQWISPDGTATNVSTNDGLFDAPDLSTCGSEWTDILLEELEVLWLSQNKGKGEAGVRVRCINGWVAGEWHTWKKGHPFWGTTSDNCP